MPVSKRHRLAQARLGANPLPDHARHTLVLRANPYPEVTDPIYRLSLPKFFYLLEVPHLGDQLRICVRAGATPPHSPLPDFQGPRGRSEHRRNCGALRVPKPTSLLEGSREIESFCRRKYSARVSQRRKESMKVVAFHFQPPTYATPLSPYSARLE